MVVKMKQNGRLEHRILSAVLLFRGVVSETSWIHCSLLRSPLTLPSTHPILVPGMGSARDESRAVFASIGLRWEYVLLEATRMFCYGLVSGML